MANSSANVSVGKPKIGGAIYRAPKGTALPTDATTTLNTAFKCLGYISEDGLTNANSPQSGEINAWGGDTVHTYNGKKTDTFNFTLLECLNVDVLKTVFGEDNVSGAIDTGITIQSNNKQQANCSYIVETVLNGAIKRIIVPDAGVTEVGEVTYTDEQAVAYAVTITALPDTSANTHYEYIVKQPTTPTTPEED